MDYCEDCQANVLDEAECPWVRGYCVDCCQCEFHTTGEVYDEDEAEAKADHERSRGEAW